MTRRKVLQASLELPFAPPLLVEGTAAVAPEAVPMSPPTDKTHPGSSLPPLTKAQVHYWRELCGVLTQAGAAGVPDVNAFPLALQPSRSTLAAMVERGILARRKRAWLGDVAPALAELSGQPDKDFGRRVRTRRHELGLPVAPASKVLPLHATQPPLDPPKALKALDAEPPDAEQERARWRLQLAERRMREAYMALEEAEQQGATPAEQEWLAAVFTHESTVYSAAMAACEERVRT
jgi:hypothetical protein